MIYWGDKLKNKEYELGKIKVEVINGKVVLNSLWIDQYDQSTIVVSGDMRSKYASVVATSGDTVYIGKTSETIHLNEESEIDCALVTFEKVPSGFEVRNAWCSRYTLGILLVNTDVPSIEFHLWP